MATLKDYRVSVLNVCTNSVIKSEVVRSTSKAAAAAPFFAEYVDKYLDVNRCNLKGCSQTYLSSIVEERLNVRITVDIVAQVTCSSLNKEQAAEVVNVVKTVRRRRRRNGKSTTTNRQFTVDGKLLDMSVRTTKKSA